MSIYIFCAGARGVEATLVGLFFETLHELKRQECRLSLGLTYHACFD